MFSVLSHKFNSIAKDACGTGSYWSTIEQNDSRTPEGSWGPKETSV